MTFATLLPLLLQYAPEAIGLISHTVQNIAAGRSQATVTDADWVALDALANQTGEEVYLRLGIPPPPKETPSTG